MGYGMSSGAFNGAPYSSVNTLTSVVFPLTATDMKAPALPPVRPFGQIVAADVSLKSPVVIQWNATVERSFGRGQLLSLGYIGSSGRRLLRTESTPSYTGAYDMLMQTSNGASSTYKGFQAQFRRRMVKNLQMQFSYTLGYAKDTASNDMGMAGFATLSDTEPADSDFDIRHNLNYSGSYRLPGIKTPILRTLLNDWNADWIATYRSGLPFNVQGVSGSASTTSSTSTSTTSRRGVFAQVRPNLTGKPVWISDASVPGGKRLNPDAFSAPSGYSQGNLERNSLRGFSATQVDFSLRRQITLHESWRLQIAAQAYNVLNHPNFSNPSGMEGANMSSPNFGIATRMANQGMGGGGSMYGSGGPRSVELTLRLQF